MSRHFVAGVVSGDECRGLVAAAASLGRQGARAGTCAASLADVAREAPCALAPLVRVRERCRAQAEARTGCFAGELNIVLTALVAWHPGAAIGFHADDVREVCRDVTCVLFLSDGDGGDFSGGELLFEAGAPARVVPRRGTLSVYSSRADDRHGVAPVSSGVRHTLAMWLSRDPSHATEDGEVCRTALAHLPALSAKRGGTHADPPFFAPPAEAEAAFRTRSACCGGVGEGEGNGVTGDGVCDEGDWRDVNARALGLDTGAARPGARMVLEAAVGEDVLRGWWREVVAELPNWLRTGILA